MENIANTTQTPNDLLARERAAWIRYQAFTRTPKGDTMIASCVLPRLWGYLQAKIDSEVAGRDMPPVASRMLEILEEALDDVGA